MFGYCVFFHAPWAFLRMATMSACECFEFMYGFGILFCAASEHGAGGSNTSCFSSVSTLYQRYHDDEWGRPVHDDGVLFESLCLSTQQCGVAWETVLKKRDAYREVYVNWDAAVLAAWSEDDVRRVLELPDARVIRHKGKVNAIVNAAQGVQKLAARGESLSDFVWRFVPEGKPIVRSHVTLGAPQFTAEAEAMSEALKKLGFSFIGPTVAYAFMQAVGIVNDHHPHCAQAVARRE